MKKNPFTGLGIAMVTPFNEDGSIDFPSLERLTESLVSNGADFICVLGSTSEVPCISPSEAEDIKRTVVRVNKGRLPLLLGMSDTTDLTGFDGILSAAPSYNKPRQEGIYRHFAAVASATKLPVVLYNIPGRTGVNITAATTLRLARDFDNIVAIKEASGNITQIEDIMQAKTQNFDVISGDDAITYELIGLGAAGVISVIGNSLTALFSRMIHDQLEGRGEEAREIHRQLNDIYKLMSVDGNPAGIKALLSLQGRIKDVLRLPLIPATEQTHDELRKALAHLPTV